MNFPVNIERYIRSAGTNKRKLFDSIYRINYFPSPSVLMQLFRRGIERKGFLNISC